MSRPVVAETTAQGAAYLAGLAVDYWKGLGEIEEIWRADRIFDPAPDRGDTEALYSGWKKAVQRACSWEEPA